MPASLARVHAPLGSALACRVQRQRLRMCRRAARKCCAWRNRAARRGRVHTARLSCVTSASSVAAPLVRCCADLASQQAAPSVRCLPLTCAFSGAQPHWMHRRDDASWTSAKSRGAAAQAANAVLRACHAAAPRCSTREPDGWVAAACMPCAAARKRRARVRAPRERAACCARARL